jgi:hypothetical protein
MSNAPGLKASIQEQIEHQRETQWRREGVAERLIVMSRESGMDAADMAVFESLSGPGWLIVVRCPKPEARAWHGVFSPKTAATEANTGSSGLVVTARRIMVSDYDLMSVWRRSPEGWQKLFIAPEGGAKRGPLTPQARRFMLSANRRLRSRLQHGCQDDWLSPRNRGVKAGDLFAVFMDGRAQLLREPAACALFYRVQRLAWPYDGAGRFVDR